MMSKKDKTNNKEEDKPSSSKPTITNINDDTIEGSDTIKKSIHDIPRTSPGSERSNPSVVPREGQPAGFDPPTDSASAPLPKDPGQLDSEPITKKGADALKFKDAVNHYDVDSLDYEGAIALIKQLTNAAPSQRMVVSATKDGDTIVELEPASLIAEPSKDNLNSGNASKTIKRTPISANIFSTPPNILSTKPMHLIRSYISFDAAGSLSFNSKMVLHEYLKHLMTPGINEAPVHSVFLGLNEDIIRDAGLSHVGGYLSQPDGLAHAGSKVVPLVSKINNAMARLSFAVYILQNLKLIASPQTSQIVMDSSNEIYSRLMANMIPANSDTVEPSPLLTLASHPHKTISKRVIEYLNSEEFDLGKLLTTYKVANTYNLIDLFALTVDSLTANLYNRFSASFNEYLTNSQLTQLLELHAEPRARISMINSPTGFATEFKLDTEIAKTTWLISYATGDVLDGILMSMASNFVVTCGVYVKASESSVANITIPSNSMDNEIRSIAESLRQSNFARAVQVIARSHILPKYYPRLVLPQLSSNSVAATMQIMYLLLALTISPYLMLFFRSEIATFIYSYLRKHIPSEFSQLLASRGTVNGMVGVDNRLDAYPDYQGYTPSMFGPDFSASEIQSMPVLHRIREFFKIPTTPINMGKQNAEAPYISDVFYDYYGQTNKNSVPRLVTRVTELNETFNFIYKRLTNRTNLTSAISVYQTHLSSLINHVSNGFLSGQCYYGVNIAYIISRYLGNMTNPASFFNGSFFGDSPAPYGIRKNSFIIGQFPDAKMEGEEYTLGDLFAPALAMAVPTIYDTQNGSVKASISGMLGHKMPDPVEVTSFFLNMFNNAENSLDPYTIMEILYQNAAMPDPVISEITNNLPITSPASYASVIMPLFETMVKTSKVPLLFKFDNKFNNMIATAENRFVELHAIRVGHDGNYDTPIAGVSVPLKLARNRRRELIKAAIRISSPSAPYIKYAEGVTVKVDYRTRLTPNDAPDTTFVEYYVNFQPDNPANSYFFTTKMQDGRHYPAINVSQTTNQDGIYIATNIPVIHLTIRQKELVELVPMNKMLLVQMITDHKMFLNIPDLGFTYTIVPVNPSSSLQDFNIQDFIMNMRHNEVNNFIFYDSSTDSDAMSTMYTPTYSKKLFTNSDLEGATYVKGINSRLADHNSTDFDIRRLNVMHPGIMMADVCVNSDGTERDIYNVSTISVMRTMNKNLMPLSTSMVQINHATDYSDTIN